MLLVHEHLVSVSFQVRNRQDVICFDVKCAKTVKVQIKVKIKSNALSVSVHSES